MINIRFTQRNLLYHVFSIDLLSLSVDSNLSSAILDLKRPQIVYSFYRLTDECSNLPSNSDILPSKINYSNASISVSNQQNFNHVVDTESLLHDKSKTRQKKRNRQKNNLHYSLDAVENVNRNHSDLVRTTHEKDIMDKKTAKFVNDTIGKGNSSLLNNKPTVIIDNPLTIDELSKLVSLSQSEIIKFLFLKGICVTINQVVGIDIATSIAEDYGFVVVHNSKSANVSENNLNGIEIYNNEPRAPIITLLGETGCGKTSLLRKIKNVSNQEVNNITQAIETYEINFCLKNHNRTAIILDTPGHEAFISMRSLSIKVTDLIILVIDAKRDLSAQTIRVINDIEGIQIPVVIVINKIDTAMSDVNKLKQTIINHDSIPRKWKNNIPILPVSAMTGQNLNVLLSNITTIVEKLDLKADPRQKASGVIYNAYLDRNKGPIIDVIIRNGTLYVGDFIVSGNDFGKVRVIKDKQGNKLQSVGPSSVVEVWGFSKIPSVGHTFTVTKNEKEAKKTVNYFLKNENMLSLQRQLNSRIAANISSNLREVNTVHQIKLIIKTDTPGSIEAILLSLSNFLQLKIQLNVISTAVGMITETDIKLAIITKSIVIGFNTCITPGAEIIAEKYAVDVRKYKIIYDVVHDIESYIQNSLETKHTENCIGHVTVCSVFSLATGIVAGCIVDSGKITYDSVVEVVRNKSIIYKGPIKSLKHMKNDIFEAKQGDKFGMLVTDFYDWKINDKIKVFNIKDLKYT